MAELIWTAEAERWLRDIHDYIAQDNPSADCRFTISELPPQAWMYLFGLLAYLPQ